MKSAFLKTNLFTLLMLALVTVMLPSCDRDDETPELPISQSLIGTWDIDSYVLDDDEWMGLIMESASITFGELQINSGIFTQEVTFADGETTSLSGRYVLDETLGQVTMYYEGEPIVADITITNGNKLLWDSVEQGYPLVLKATKR